MVNRLMGHLMASCGKKGPQPHSIRQVRRPRGLTGSTTSARLSAPTSTAPVPTTTCGPMANLSPFRRRRMASTEADRLSAVVVVNASGFRLEPNGTVTEFGGNFDYPNGINDRGEIIGSAARPVLPGAFLYAYGMYSFFKFPGSGFTNAYGINNRGQIVGAWTDFAEPVHGFVLTPSNEIEDVSASASPDGTRIPVVSVIADDHLTTWTLRARAGDPARRCASPRRIRLADSMVARRYLRAG